MPTLTGAVLAGGLGRRMGAESKPGVDLGGRAMVLRPLEALREVCESVAVVCKPDTGLPELPEAVAVWHEPGEPRHPLTGILYALARAHGPVLFCGADMPFITADALRRLVREAERYPAARAVVAHTRARVQPLVSLLRPTAVAALREARPDASLSRTFESLQPAWVRLDPQTCENVNSREDLELAERRLRSGPPVTPGSHGVPGSG